MTSSIQEQFAHALSDDIRTRIAQDPDRLAYHIMPPAGWLNDPNGLHEKDGVTNIYFQFAPQNAQGSGAKGWGHYSTTDFIHYKEQPVAVYPDCGLDEGGAYSGSAFVEDDGTVSFYYTGNRKLLGDYDYIYEGRQHFTCKLTSKDGNTLENKHVLLKNSDYPENMSCHVRDPKVWKQNGSYYMVLGARTRDDKGQILVYTSKDGENWNLHGEIHGDQDYGYMWECPDLFEIGGHTLLITCLQGAKQTGFDFEYIYPAGWFEVDGNPADDKMMTAHNFHALDHGFDYYAPQSYIDENGRRILIAWMGIPDVEYTNREEDAGWKHALSLPRELRFEDGKLLQYPIREIFGLRQMERQKTIELGDNASHRLPGRVCEVELEPLEKEWMLTLRKDLRLEYRGGVLTLMLGESGRGREVRHASVDHIDTLSIFSDTSSVEIFVNGGEVSMTTRVYDDEKDALISADREMRAVVYPLTSFTIE